MPEPSDIASIVSSGRSGIRLCLAGNMSTFCFRCDTNSKTAHRFSCICRAFLWTIIIVSCLERKLKGERTRSFKEMQSISSIVPSRACVSMFWKAGSDICRIDSSRMMMLWNLSHTILPSSSNLLSLSLHSALAPKLIGGNWKKSPIRMTILKPPNIFVIGSSCCHKKAHRWLIFPSHAWSTMLISSIIKMLF